MGKAWNTFLAISTAGLSIPVTNAIDRGKEKRASAAVAAPEPIPLPQAPKVEDAADKAQETVRKKRAAITKSVYSSPLGLAGEADVARKTLTGQ